MSIMARQGVDTGVNPPETPTRERLQAEAAELLIDASRTAWYRRRKAALLAAKDAGMSMERARQILCVSRGTVDKDIAAALAERAASQAMTEAGASDANAEG